MAIAALTVATFVEWYRDDPAKALDSLGRISGGVGATLATLAVLTGCVLVVRPTVGMVTLVLSFVTALIGVAGMYVVGPFWLLPLPFVWSAYRGANDA